jgi:hypothetical protein
MVKPEQFRAHFGGPLFSRPVILRANEKPTARPLLGGVRHGEGFGDDAVEAVLLRVAHCTDVDAEALVDSPAAAEGELRAASARVEHDERSVAQPESGLHGEIREPALFLARDDFDVDVTAPADLLAKVALPDYRARVERVIVIEVEAFDWNCPQHITPRYTEAEIEDVARPLRERIAALEAQLAELSSV